MATTITREAGDKKIKAAVGAGETSSAIYVTGQCVVAAVPGSGGTMLVEASWSIAADVASSTATWFPWDAGTVSAKTNQLLQFATAVRFTATTAAGIGEVAS